MTLRIIDNIHKTGFDPGENRGNLPVICPSYCEKCGQIFMGDNCTDTICKKCGDKTMKTWYFTFGCGIDNLHRNCYHKIEAETDEDARKKMFERFGAKWAFQYDSAEAAGINKWNLIEINAKGEVL